MFMPMFAVLEFLPPVLNILIWLVSVFLILLILIQKGKGGGLAGAFGGPGGQSAFGSKTADAFTKVTLYVAGVWVALVVMMIWLVQPRTVISSPADSAVTSTETTPAEGAAKTEGETKGEKKEGAVKEETKAPAEDKKEEKKSDKQEKPAVKEEKKAPVEAPKNEAAPKGESKKN